MLSSTLERVFPLWRGVGFPGEWSGSGSEAEEVSSWVIPVFPGAAGRHSKLNKSIE